MKPDSLRIRHLLLCCAGVWCSLGTVCTALALPVAGWPVLPFATLLWAGLCLPALHYRGGRLATAALAAAAVLLTALLTDQVSGFFGAIVRGYEDVFNFSAPGFFRAEPADLTLGAAVLGGLLIRLGLAALEKGRSRTFLVLLLILPASILPLKDALPSPAFFGGLLVCSLLLLMSADAADSRQSARIRFLAALPAVLAVLILFRAIPQQTYVNRSEELRESLAEVTADFLQMLNILPEGTADRIDLRALSDFEGGGEEVARISSDCPGVIYLRQQDYDRYTGTAWEATANRTETLSGSGDELGTVVLALPKSEKKLLLPSFPEEEIIFTDGAAENTSAQTVFRLTLQKKAMGGQPGVAWLELPASEIEELRTLALSVVPLGSDTDTAARAIGEFVKSRAGYSTTPDKLPAGQDFALWFLQEAEQGYCTHYAASAAALLRAYGIPARFVVGYRAEVRGTDPVSVTQNNAHAWVEYYNYQSWTWSILEVTPGFEEPTEPEEETEPPTQPPTETAPTQPTQPTQSTPPSESTEPPEDPPEELPQWLWYIPAAVLLLLLPELQRTLRIRLRAKRRSTGPANIRARRLWKETVRLSRLLKREPPAVLQDLAEKAVWSDHVLTAQELRRMEAGNAALRRLLRRESWYRQLLYRYVWAVL